MPSTQLSGNFYLSVYRDGCTVIVNEIEFVINIIQCVIDGNVGAVIFVGGMGEYGRYVCTQKKLKQQKTEQKKFEIPVIKK